MGGKIGFPTVNLKTGERALSARRGLCLPLVLIRSFERKLHLRDQHRPPPDRLRGVRDDHRVVHPRLLLGHLRRIDPRLFLPPAAAGRTGVPVHARADGADPQGRRGDAPLVPLARRGVSASPRRPRSPCLVLALGAARRARGADGERPSRGSPGAAAVFGAGPGPAARARRPGRRAPRGGAPPRRSSGADRPLAARRGSGEGDGRRSRLRRRSSSPRSRFRGAGLAAALLGAAAVVRRRCRSTGPRGCLREHRGGLEAGAVAGRARSLLPGLVGGGLLALGERPSGRPRGSSGPRVGARSSPSSPGCPPFLLERRRVLRELSEEARLGILPDEDLAVLGNPWRRAPGSRGSAAPTSGAST